MRFHHLGVAVPDLDKALEAYQSLLGYRPLSERCDDPIQKVSVRFIGNGDPGGPMLELISPTAPDSPIKSVLAQGGGAYHLCYEAADLDDVLKRAEACRCIVVARPVPAVAFGGRRIAWFYMPTRQLIELVESEAGAVKR